MADLPKIKGLRILRRLKSKAWHSFYEGVLIKGEIPVVIEALDVRTAPDSSLNQLKERYALLSELEVENVSSPLLFGEEDNLLFLAVEKETEDRLVDHLGQGEFLDPSEAVRLVMELARTLKSIHDLGHVHGELSPSNVLFHEHGRVKLKNVFRFQHDRDYLLSLLPRRSKYITPEHLRMSEVTPLSDQYLLGVILYQLLTGQPPFSGDDIKEVWRLHLEEPMPPLPDHLEAIEGLEDVLGKMLSKRSKDRFDSDDKLLAALEEVEDVLLSGEVPEEEGTYYVMESLPETPMVEANEKELTQESEEKKKKPVGKGKLQKGKRNWKKKVDSKSNSGKKTSRRSGSASSKPESRNSNKTADQQSSSILPIVASVAAVVVIGGIIVFWLTQGIDPHERGEEGTGETFQPVKVVSNTTPKKPTVEPKTPKVEEPIKQPITRVTPQQPTVDSSQEETVLEGEMSEKNREKLRGIQKLPRKEAIARLQLLLEDDDPMVRSIAAQTLVDVKGKVDLEEEYKLEGDDLLGAGLEKIEFLDSSRLISYLTLLVSSGNRDPAVKKILLAASKHQDPSVVETALNQLLKLSPSDYSKELASRLVDSPPDKLLYKKALLEPKSFLEIVAKKSVADPEAHLQLLGLWEDKKDWKGLVSFMSKDDVFFMPVLLILANGGTEGRKELNLLLEQDDWSVEQRTLLLSVHRAIRSNPQALMSLTNENSRKSSPYIEAYYKSLSDTGEAETKDTSMKWAYALRLADLSDSPTEEELETLVSAVGSLDSSMNRRLLKALGDSPDQVVPLMIRRMKSKPNKETRSHLLDFIIAHPSRAGVAFLIQELESKIYKDDELALIRKGIEIAQELSMTLLLESSKSAYQKAKILSDLDLSGRSEALAELLDEVSATEFKRLVSHYLKNFSEREELIRELLVGMKNPSHLSHLVLSIRKVEHGLSGEMVNLLDHEDEDVRSEALENILERFPGTASLYKEVAQKISDEKLKTMLIKHIAADNEHYEFLMTGFLSDESRKVRESVLDLLIKAKKWWGTPRFLNRLFTEERASLKGKLARHLLTDIKVAHPLALLWGEENLPSSSRKKLKMELAERGAKLDELKRWKGMLSDPYVWPLKKLLLEYLSRNGVMALDEFYKVIDMRKEKSLTEFHTAVDVLGSRAVPNLLTWMSKATSPLIREEIKKALDKMEVKYRLDPATGRYISL